MITGWIVAIIILCLVYSELWAWLARRQTTDERWDMNDTPQDWNGDQE